MALGLGVNIGISRSKATSIPALNFSGLINLPTSRRSTVQRAAYRAASGQSYSAQQVIDALVSLNFTSFLPQDGCCFSDTGGTSQLLTAGTVNSFKGWASTSLRGVSNAAKTIGSNDSDGINLAASYYDLQGINGNADGTLLFIGNNTYGSTATNSRCFEIGATTSSLAPTNTDAIGLNVLRLGVQGANNINFAGSVPGGLFITRLSSRFVTTNTRDCKAWNGNALLKEQTIVAGGSGVIATFTGNAILGTQTAGGFAGRVKGYAFIPNVTQFNLFERITRFCQFYFNPPVMRALIDRPIILCGTSITHGAGASGNRRWSDIVQLATHSVLYNHGQGSNRITSTGIYPEDNVFSATISQAVQATESYESLLIPYLNIQSTPPIVIIDHNVNDNNQTVGTLSLSNTSKTNYIGALNFIANAILAVRPDAVILGQTGWPDARLAGTGTQINQVNIDQAMRDWCNLRGFSCIDVAAILNSELGLNTYTINNLEFATYLADSVHPTPAGHALIGNAVVKELDRIFST